MRKSFRDKFEENYAAVIVKDKRDREKVKYVYFGLWHIWDLPQKELLKVKRKILALYAATVLLFLILSTRSVAINMVYSIDLCVALSLCALIFELIAVLHFYFAKYKAEKLSYNSVHLTLKVVPILYVCFIATSVLISFYYIFFVSFSSESLAVVLGYVLSAVLQFCIWWIYHPIPLRTEKNNSLDKYDMK